MKKRILFLLLILLIFVACASSRKAQLQEFYKRLDSNIGIMTYDDAIMRWGEPTSTTKGENIFVVTWGSEKSGTAVIPWRGTIFTAPISHGWKLRLTFDKTTQKMINWYYKEW